MNILQAILKIKSDAQVSASGNNIDTLEWHDGNPTNITKEQIQAKINETAYIDKRQAEYPSWQDQMDMQYHDKVNGTSTWQTVIAKVKSDNPKE